jgi:hypothetical protein
VPSGDGKFKKILCKYWINEEMTRIKIRIALLGNALESGRT